MKKIFFAALMLLALGAITNAQTTPVKSSQKKTVNSVSPTKPTKSNTAVAKTTAKPATASSTSSPGVSSSTIGKHKRARHTAKKHNKKS